MSDDDLVTLTHPEHPDPIEVTERRARLLTREGPEGQGWQRKDKPQGARSTTAPPPPPAP